VKAVVLVGGFGTRLRPLTETKKKELLPLVDRPILDHTLDRLVRHGVDEVVMSSPYLEEAFHPFIVAREGVPKIRWVTEETPLGTGGAIVHALGELGGEAFFALNGDICTDLDLTAMRAFHAESSSSVTIALHHVEDARAFGLVDTEPDGRVRAFREKPADHVPGEINAGTYLIDPGVLAPWTADREISIEREIFPAVISSGAPMYGYLTQAYWLDLGTPDKYLLAHHDLLAGRLEGSSYPAPWVHPAAEVHPGASLGPWVAVGEGASISDGAMVEDSVLHPGSRVGARAHVTGSILGEGSMVGAGAHLTGCVLGAGAVVPDGLELIDATVGTGETAGT
jgi:mannose-1-phosphate guanylyltransferase